MTMEGGAMSDVTRKRLELFEQVTQYALDNPAYYHAFSNRNGLELTRETFHAKLYASRLLMEQEVRSALLTSEKPICVRGHGGSGKTSLVSNVLHHLRDDFQELIFDLDFKAIP